MPRRNRRPQKARYHSKGVKREHSCNGKVRFRDQKDAIGAIHLISSRGTREVVPKRAYECPRCGGWHLTSQSSWGKQ